MPDIRILTEGDSSVLVEFGKEISPEINRKITATVQLMKEQHIEGVVDMIPAFCSLLVNYDPRVISYDDLKKRLEILLKMEVTAGEGCRKVYEIPVCYGGEYGPDIENIAEHAGLSVEEVIKIHSSRDYLIYMLGFLPGFCYPGGITAFICWAFCPASRIWAGWMKGSIHPVLQIPESRSMQEVWESVVPRQGFILWILREDGS